MFAIIVFNMGYDECAAFDTLEGVKATIMEVTNITNPTKNTIILIIIFVFLEITITNPKFNESNPKQQTSKIIYLRWLLIFETQTQQSLCFLIILPIDDVFPVYVKNNF